MGFWTENQSDQLGDLAGLALSPYPVELSNYFFPFGFFRLGAGSDMGDVS
jgi:hypothetical protein